MTQPPLDPQRQEQARKYAKLMRSIFFIELTLGAIFLLALLLSDLSSGLRNLLDFPQPARVVLYFLIVMLSYIILSAPLGFYRGFVLPHRYGLSHQNLRSWLADGVKGGLFGLALGSGVVVVIYQFLEISPQAWWLLAFAFVTLVTVVLTTLAPVLIVPLFFKLEPIVDPALRQRLLRLAERCQTKIKDVFLINLGSKTSAGNAMVMGLGKTRRIVLGDTLLQHYTPEEIESIMAHELGHHRHGDIARLIGMQSALLLCGFYVLNLTLHWAVPRLDFSGISDVAALPLLALVLAAFALAVMPLTNAYSRRLESNADRYALANTNPDAFTTMLAKLTDQNLAESEPSRWAELLFYDHPPYSQRVEQARRYQREED